MTAAKLRSGSSVWSGYSLTLSDDDVDCLIGAVAWGQEWPDDAPKTGDLRFRVEYILGSYLGAKDYLEKSPTSLGITKEVLKIQSATQNLLGMIVSSTGISDATRDLIVARLPEQQPEANGSRPLDTLAVALAGLHDACVSVQRDLHPQETRGRRPKLGRRSVLEQLARVFEEFATVPRNVERTGLPFEPRSDWSHARIDFIRTALAVLDESLVKSIETREKESEWAKSLHLTPASASSIEADEAAISRLKSARQDIYYLMQADDAELAKEIVESMTPRSEPGDDELTAAIRAATAEIKQSPP